MFPLKMYDWYDRRHCSIDFKADLCAYVHIMYLGMCVVCLWQQFKFFQYVPVSIVRYRYRGESYAQGLKIYNLYTSKYFITGTYAFLETFRLSTAHTLPNFIIFKMATAFPYFSLELVCGTTEKSLIHGSMDSPPPALPLHLWSDTPGSRCIYSYMMSHKNIRYKCNYNCNNF